VPRLSDRRYLHTPVATVSLVVGLIAHVPVSVRAEQPAWVTRNTEQLLARVQAAPRLALEMSEFVLKLPTEDWEIGMVSSIAASADGLFYVLQRNTDIDAVIVVDGDGNVKRSWGRGLYSIAHSIRIDSAGNVWTVDSGNSWIYKFTPDGEQLLGIDVGEMPDKVSPFRGAADIAFGPDGHLFVADGYGNARVLEYDSAGRRLREWGEAGSGSGEFNLVHGIAIDTSSIIYVADRENGRIQRFDRNGNLLGIWDGLGRVVSVHIDGDALWVAVQRLDQPGGSVGWLLRLNRDDGSVDGLVAIPETHGVTISPRGEPLVGLRPNRILWYRHVPGK